MKTLKSFLLLNLILQFARALSTDELAELQCALFTDWVIFDLRGLENTADYKYSETATNTTDVEALKATIGTMQSTFTFQFCQYTSLS